MTTATQPHTPHAEGIFVITKLQEGFRVHSPETEQVFMVGPDLDNPVCTCPEFSQHRHDPTWACAHVEAVRAQSSSTRADSTGRSSLQRVNGAAQLSLKRSISPDGRIDSLSVELACPVDLETPGGIPALAARSLGLQAEIVQGFLGRPQNGNGRAAPVAAPTNGGNGTVPGEILSIAGMNTRFGRRMFLNVRCNGKVLKLFGNEKRLAEAIEAAGFPEAADFIEEGLSLNLPCRVSTKPSDNGRYVNVDAVYPAARNG